VSTLHFMNVGQGDCIWIRHADAKNTVIDVCNGRSQEPAAKSDQMPLIREMLEILELRKGVGGNFRQKDYPVNPVEYLKSFGVDSIFRFILTHPDMDHLDGIGDLFKEFGPTNFWDSENNKEMEEFDEGRYSLADWEFYKSLRDGTNTSAKRLTLYSGSKGVFYNQAEDGTGGGNGLHVLAPTKQLIAAANTSGDFNDSSYVLLYLPNNKRVVIGGDSHDVTWEHILEQHKKDVTDIDLLIAPHHGRDSDRSYEFLDVLKPKLTLFGVARSEHMGYSAWIRRDLEVMTNNQGNCFVMDFISDRMDVYCTNETFARAYRTEHYRDEPFFSHSFKAWYLKSI